MIIGVEDFIFTYSTYCIRREFEVEDNIIINTVLYTIIAWQSREEALFEIIIDLFIILHANKLQ